MRSAAAARWRPAGLPQPVGALVRRRRQGDDLHGHHRQREPDEIPPCPHRLRPSAGRRNAASPDQQSRNPRAPEACLSRVPRRVASTVLTGPRRSNAPGLPDNQLHWIRDVAFDEDDHRASTGNAPQVMASLRNLTISILRLTGATNIAQALCPHARQLERPLQAIMKPELLARSLAGALPPAGTVLLSIDERTGIRRRPADPAATRPRRMPGVRVRTKKIRSTRFPFNSDLKILKPLFYPAFILGPNIPTLTRVTRRILRDVDMPTSSGPVFFYVDITATILSGYNPSSHTRSPQWNRHRNSSSPYCRSEPGSNPKMTVVTPPSTRLPASLKITPGSAVRVPRRTPVTKALYAVTAPLPLR
ncbi:conserved hypothetical protein [Frankia sp. Hr75.2]|nr:conserved hypothetical protein [Frankia sp. Hr75.2]